MTEQSQIPVLVNFDNDIALFQRTVKDRVQNGILIGGTVMIASGADPQHSVTRLLPFTFPPVKGKEAVPQFFAVACITRDLVLTLVSLNRRFGLGMDAALDLLAMTHPMVEQALKNGSVDVDDTKPGENPKRVIRDVVDVGAGAKGGQS